jgi:hypothetical protein
MYSKDELYSLDAGLIFTGDYGMKGGSPAPPVQGKLACIYVCMYVCMYVT